MPRKWFLTALGGTTGGNGTAGQGRVPLQRGPQAGVLWPAQHRQPAVSIYSTERASQWTPSMASMPSALGFLLTIHLIRVGILREAGRMWQAIAPLGELEAELDRTGVAGSERE
jgi:hypothetical protein